MNWYETLTNSAISIISVLFGGYISLIVAKKQLKIEQENDECSDFEELKYRYERLAHEHQNNFYVLSSLITISNECRNSRNDIWEYLISKCSYFDFDAFEDIKSTHLMKKLPKELQNEIYRNYRSFSVLIKRCNEYYAAHRFYLGYCGDEERANALFHELKETLISLKSQISNTKEFIEEYKF